MKKRIFIAINLPSKVKNKLAEMQDDLQERFELAYTDSPIKWTKKENLHVTLLFLGLIDDVHIPELLKIIEESIQESEVFDLFIDNIVYGPNINNPKMIWANIKITDELLVLQNNLQNLILENDYDAELDRKFKPHITLGRINQWEFKSLNKEEVPGVDDYLGMGFAVKSIDVMESFLEKKGPTYCILNSYNLKQ